MIEKKYASILDPETKIVSVGFGVNDEYYKEIGMEIMDVEYSELTHHWYLAGYAPKLPEPTVLDKKANMRALRDDYITDIEWRVSRYRDQKEMDIPTTDSDEKYMKILLYMQYLRDYPESSDDWYEHEPLTFKEWLKTK